MKKVLVAVMAGLFLSGCNAGAQRVWDRKGSYSTNDFNRDKYTCIKEGNQVFPINNQLRDGGFLGYYTTDVNRSARDSFFADCMRAKNWYLKPSSQ